MVEITRVGETKQGRFALFSEEQFLFSVDAQTLSQYDLHEGSSLEDGELSALKRCCDTRKAKDRALRLLGRRAHSRSELARKLLQYHDEYCVQAALDELAKLELLDDSGFATARAEQLSEQGRSRLEIRDRLRAAGVGREEIDDALHSPGVDDVLAALRVLRKQYVHRLDAGEREKVCIAMSRRGFSFTDIVKALEQFEQE